MAQGRAVGATGARARRTGAAGGRPWQTMTGTTHVVGILGDPVEHSLSPVMHNAAFEALGLDYCYVPFHVRPAELARAIDGVRALGLAGLNITVPHKEAVLPLLDTISPAARKLGAVNTIVRHGRRLIGHNTDGRGFLASLAAERVAVEGRAAVLIGAGGAARSVSAALLSAKCAHITIVNRTPARARRLARELDGRRRRIETASWAALGDGALIRSADLVVNCTPLGLQSEQITALPFKETHRRCVFVDLVYRREPTPFLRRAKRLRRRTVDGTGMLLHQGALAFSLWTGRRAPIAVMTRALHQVLANTR
jgi:shikimate dehydrogenase